MILTSCFLLLVVRPGTPFVASLLLVAMPFVTSSFLILTSKHLKHEEPGFLGHQ